MTTLYEYVIQKQMQSNRTSFWGRYEELNKAIYPGPTAQMIHDYQLEKIKSAQKIVENAAAANAKEFQEISDLILNTNSGSVSEYENEQNQKIAQAIQNIFNNISEMRDVKKRQNIKKQQYLNATERKQQYLDMMELLKQLYVELEDIKKTLNISAGVYEAQLRKVQNIINNLSNFKTINNKAFNQFWKNINSFQGDLLEELGTEWFNNRIPQDMNIQMVATGNVVLHTSGKDGRHSGQLISDLLALSVDAFDLDEIEIEYTLKGKKHKASLAHFISLLNNYTGSKKIVIEDNAYDTLLSLSKLNIQAKSGKKQLPWNINKSTAISINDFEDKNVGGYISVWRTFNLLYSLDTEDPYDKWVENSDKDNYYQALANYGLATALWKVLHLDHKDGNQYLLTSKGFMTFSQRFCEMFGNTPSTYAKLNSHVFSQGRLLPLDTLYNVSIPWQSIN